MTFLLSNDDGVFAPGLEQLAKSMAEAGHSIYVVAPDQDRSGASNSLTLDRPLKPTALKNGFISVNGTPADCVNLGMNTLCLEEPARVISGINSGANLGDDVLYSGTVAAAMEGRFLAKSPIAVSLVGKKYFETAAQVIIDILPKLESLCLPDRTVININVPDVPFDELKGIEITRLGHRHRCDPPVKTQSPHGKDYYWINGVGAGNDAGPGTDFYAVANNIVSITAIQVDMTAYDGNKQLQSCLSIKSKSQELTK
ncbi:MAG: 5'-nucleotidase [Bermanella sp.]|jgi:5'-nucleotidase